MAYVLSHAPLSRFSCVNDTASGGSLLGQGLSNRTVMLCNDDDDDDDDGDAKKNKRHRELIRGLGIRQWRETKQKVGWNTSMWQVESKKMKNGSLARSGAKRTESNQSSLPLVHQT